MHSSFKEVTSIQELSHQILWHTYLCHGLLQVRRPALVELSKLIRSNVPLPQVGRAHCGFLVCARDELHQLTLAEKIVHHECVITGPAVLSGIVNVHRPFANKGSAFFVRRKGKNTPVTRINWVSSRIVFAENQFSDDTVNAIRTDEDVARMGGSIGAGELWVSCLIL